MWQPNNNAWQKEKEELSYFRRHALAVYTP